MELYLLKVGFFFCDNVGCCIVKINNCLGMKPSFQIYGLFPKKTKYVWPNYLDNVTVTPVGLIAAPYCEFSTMFPFSNKEV